MVDGHIHIERGNYSLDWINEFVSTALERNIEEIYLLEHSHRFREFTHVYNVVSEYNDYQRDWLKRKMMLSIEEYKAFILEMRKVEFPVKVKFGLEVCYMERADNELRDILSNFKWDFVTGSVHWIDGWGFDHRKEFWEGRDIVSTYVRYYEIMESLIKSGLFNIVAHPDSIKCFGHKPGQDLTQVYVKLADLLNEHQMLAEQSAGLKLNYGYDEIGMNRKMLDVLTKKSVKLLTVSDAHKPEDVGSFIHEMYSL